MRTVSRTGWVAILVAVALVVALSVASLLTEDSRQRPISRLSEWAWELRYKVWPIDDRTELVTLHADAAQQYRGQCVACHGDKRDSELLVHRIHLQSELLPGLSCGQCHPHVDLGSRTSTATVHWVDVGFCKDCHSAFPGANIGSSMRKEDLDADCSRCHTGDRAVQHARPYIAQDIETSDCGGCHGGRALPWTLKHERDDWILFHGTEALHTGVDDCFACHDFGLKFCDDCHAKKPPSHLPAEQWRARHPAEAQADTRVCYTCHKTGFCKNCHVNHEAGWMSTHPAFVREKGSGSCEECHSRSSCSYCHTAALEGSTQPTLTP